MNPIKNLLTQKPHLKLIYPNPNPKNHELAQCKNPSCRKIYSNSSLKKISAELLQTLDKSIKKWPIACPHCGKHTRAFYRRNNDAWVVDEKGELKVFFPSYEPPLVLKNNMHKYKADIQYTKKYIFTHKASSRKRKEVSFWCPY
jgi:hypothetical protein